MTIVAMGGSLSAPGRRVSAPQRTDRTRLRHTCHHNACKLAGWSNWDGDGGIGYGLVLVFGEHSESVFFLS